MKNIDDYTIKHKKILVRVDLNVPVVNGIIKESSRIKVIKITIKKLLEKQNKVFLISHYGRPNGKINTKYSLNFIKYALKKELEINKINFLKSFEKKQIQSMINIMEYGEVCLFENIRFYSEEEKNDLNFAKEIAKNFDIYVNDAFSASHRSHASIVGIPIFLPSFAGGNMINEIKNIDTFVNNPKKPNLAIIGGSKISTKINLLSNIVEKFDAVVIGGAMANTFLYANNLVIGNSLFEKNLYKVALSIIKKAKKNSCEIILPVDAVCADHLENDLKITYCNIEHIPSNEMVLDIGNKTIEIISKYILKSKMVLWNGPLGAFEYKPFEKSSLEIANIILNNAQKFKISTIAGGGDTLSVIKMAKAEKGFSYLSKAGGAFLEWLEGNESPGVLALKKNKII